MKPAMLTALHWPGELPRLGDYILAARGRTAFKVVEILMPTKPGARYVARFRCERHYALPHDAVIHGWEWAKRERSCRS